eukprot:TRINITY_DN2654_c0_g4_i1.p1 TRINITY_DN2654_c0_g4~~TRINITY_DN2654_c0_g4_i1.p1  ORF type:complete len:234 (+),score=78.17 TRINITY_DN2654_c0_g4_i1:76-777(+)
MEKRKKEGEECEKAVSKDEKERKKRKKIKEKKSSKKKKEKSRKKKAKKKVSTSSSSSEQTSSSESDDGKPQQNSLPSAASKTQNKSLSIAFPSPSLFSILIPPLSTGVRAQTTDVKYRGWNVAATSGPTEKPSDTSSATPTNPSTPSSINLKPQTDSGRKLTNLEKLAFGIKEGGENICCQGCEETFWFSAKERDFYEEKKFAFPKYCKTCRENRKSLKIQKFGNQEKPRTLR